ncbi:translation initiation factor IF-3 [Patescibacteria group bacterium]|nr:translation initiation factor IF-3 [Patescibacteria group bacterium]
MPKYRKNEEIKADKVILIGPEGEAKGEVDLNYAITFAKEANLDLVEVSPKAEPPVCKVLDLGQFLYEQKKKVKANQKKNIKVVVKGVKLSQNIGKHDFETKLKQGERFLSKGNKIKIELQLKGREKKYADIGKEVIYKYIENLKQLGKFDIIIEDQLSFKHGKINCIIALKKK